MSKLPPSPGIESVLSSNAATASSHEEEAVRAGRLSQEQRQELQSLKEIWSTLQPDLALFRQIYTDARKIMESPSFVAKDKQQTDSDFPAKLKTTSNLRFLEDDIEALFKQVETVKDAGTALKTLERRLKSPRASALPQEFAYYKQQLCDHLGRDRAFAALMEKYGSMLPEAPSLVPEDTWEVFHHRRVGWHVISKNLGRYAITVVMKFWVMEKRIVSMDEALDRMHGLHAQI